MGRKTCILSARPISLFKRLKSVIDKSDTNAPADQLIPSPQRFPKGFSGNPRGGPKGALGKVTKLRNFLSPTLTTSAIKVLKSVMRKAEKGSLEHEKLVINLLRPFLITQANREGNISLPGDRRTIVTVNVSGTVSAIPDKKGRVLDVKPS